MTGNMCLDHILLEALKAGKAERVQKGEDGSFSSVCGSSLNADTIKGKMIRVYVHTDEAGKETVVEIASVQSNSNTLSPRIFTVGMKGGGGQPQVPICLQASALVSHSWTDSRGVLRTKVYSDEDRST